MKALLVTYTDMILSLTLGNYRGRDFVIKATIPFVFD